MEKLLLLPILALAIASCEKEESSTVTQNKIWTGYALSYDANTGKTAADAQFKFGSGTGTLLKLTAPATVTATDSAMPYIDLLTFYRREFAGLKDSVAFKYTDTTGAVFTNTIALARPIGLPADLDTISKSAAYTLAFTGGALSSTEDMSVSITSATAGFELFIATADGTFSITLGTDQLAKLNTGLATLRIERQNYYIPVSNPGDGGLVTAKYQPASVQVVIVP